MTDIVQGSAMIILLPVILYALFSLPEISGIAYFGSQPLSPAVIASLVLTGFFVAASSADVWQRAYAAKDEKSARKGFIAGGLLFLVYGVGLSMLGIAAAALGLPDPDNAFIDLSTKTLPAWALPFLVVLLVSAISSTADTEIFLLAGLLKKELPRLGFLSAKSKLVDTIGGVRILVFAVTILSAAVSMISTDLVVVYTWLLSALVVISPIILFSLFIKSSKTGMFLSLLANSVLFAVLVSAGYLTVENAYLISVPGLLFYIATLALGKRQTHG